MQLLAQHLTTLAYLPRQEDQPYEEDRRKVNGEEAEEEGVEGEPVLIHLGPGGVWSGGLWSGEGDEEWIPSVEVWIPPRADDRAARKALVQTGCSAGAVQS